MNIQSLKSTVTAEEWQLRCDLAACYRLVALYGVPRRNRRKFRRPGQGLAKLLGAFFKKWRRPLIFKDFSTSVFSKLLAHSSLTSPDCECRIHLPGSLDLIAVQVDRSGSD